MDPSLANCSGLSPVPLLAITVRPQRPNPDLVVVDSQSSDVWSASPTPDDDVLIIIDWRRDPAAAFKFPSDGPVQFTLIQLWGIECHAVPDSFFKDWVPSVTVLGVLSNPTRVVFAGRPCAGDVVDLIDAENAAKNLHPC